MTRSLLALVPTILVLAYEDPPANPNGNPNGDQNTDPNKQMPKTFTQADVDRIVADKVKATRQSQQTIIAELEALKSSSNITQQQRDELSTRIETLQSELMTKEELAKQREAKLKKEADEQVTRTKQEAEIWRNRFTTSTIQRSIIDAAAQGDAYNPEQIVAILERNTKLVERTGEDGKGTGEYVPTVEFNDTDKEGKPITLSLHPKDAVKRMKEIEGYQNLFKGSGVGGTGSQNRGSGGRTNISELAKDPAAYRKARAEGRINF